MDYLLKGAKQKLISTLREKGISDENVIAAFEKVDRHKFIESFMWDKAYLDIALKIKYDQTISQPFTVAFQTQLLQIQKGDKVLEIGTGSGFQAAILSAMGAKVYTIERQEGLYNETLKLLEEIDHKIFAFFGDGFEGIPRYAPYDKIIVTCGAPNIPLSLINQLKINGLMVIPVGENSQKMLRITKTGEKEYTEEEFGDFIFVPMLKDTKTIH
ncbi:MAG: protein-L-isoaspartate(D-aspartate) O-methyltransferase [Bacteroidetes bacterium]|nr:protein-L-isoaspartate(D-aspartate) O-methyltransferase [Bacteroidota bacterium]MCL1968452.1 protein-L-isoaspartate(D-aspartate) O-methyltransferase [Bacteroidota bacterium]